MRILLIVFTEPYTALWRWLEKINNNFKEESTNEREIYGKRN